MLKAMSATGFGMSAYYIDIAIIIALDNLYRKYLCPLAECMLKLLMQ